MTDVSIFGQIRGTVRQYFGGAAVNVQPMLGDGGEQLVSQALPERAELVKLGKSWGAAIPLASAFTMVNAWPTARSELTLYNGESSGGPSYIVDRVWMTQASTGSTGPNVILGQIVPANALSNLTGATGFFVDSALVQRWQLSGRSSSFGSNAKLCMPAGNAGITNKWFALGPSISNAQVNAGALGQTCEAFLFGRIIVPPGAYFNLAGLGSVNAGTALLGLEWHEAYLNLG